MPASPRMLLGGSKTLHPGLIYSELDSSSLTYGLLTLLSPPPGFFTFLCDWLHIILT